MRNQNIVQQRHRQVGRHQTRYGRSQRKHETQHEQLHPLPGKSPQPEQHARVGFTSRRCLGWDRRLVPPFVFRSLAALIGFQTLNQFAPSLARPDGISPKRQSSVGPKSSSVPIPNDRKRSSGWRCRSICHDRQRRMHARATVARRGQAFSVTSGGSLVVGRQNADLCRIAQQSPVGQDDHPLGEVKLRIQVRRDPGEYGLARLELCFNCLSLRLGEHVLGSFGKLKGYGWSRTRMPPASNEPEKACKIEANLGQYKHLSNKTETHPFRWISRRARRPGLPRQNSNRTNLNQSLSWTRIYSAYADGSGL